MLTLFKPGFCWLSLTGGENSTSLRKTMLQLRKDNETWHTLYLPENYTVPNLVAKARYSSIGDVTVTSSMFFDSDIEGFFMCL